MKTNPDDSSYAKELKWSKAGVGYSADIIGGLSKREYFAGLALQGLLMSISEENENTFDSLSKKVAGASCAMADALIEELNKEKNV